jgi:hypothetical protein
MGVSAQFFGPTMNVAADRHPGVGRKACPPRWIIALDRAPQADPTCLQRFVVGDVTPTLALDEGMGQAVVLLHSLLHSLRCQLFPYTLAHEIPPF